MNAALAPNLAGIVGIARRLVLDGVLDEQQARKAIDEAAQAKKALPVWLLEKRYVKGLQLAAANAAEFGVPLLDIQAVQPQADILQLVKGELLDKHRVLPLYKRGSRLFLAITNPTDTAALDEISFATTLQIEPVLVDPDALRAVTERWRESSSTDMSAAFADSEDFGDLDISSGDDEPAEAANQAKEDDAPIVKFVNGVLMDAIRRGASDIHFEPFEDEYRVRLRIDGVLRKTAGAPPKSAQRIAARLKVVSQLDIAEKRIPQDGRMKLNLSKTRQIDFRVSTLPTLVGEKVVLRILDGSAAQLGIDQLGYEPEQQALFTNAIFKPYGMVLVTGPTGSGKTVSLYTALNMLNEEGRNISTVEDPVEIRVSGINQVQQNNKRGMTFAAALRSFLRQDPDVIMVGEIRDLETAEIAIKAAQTGHMVLSTLHTNDAPQTISRLMNMGIAPYNITSSVSLVIAQRLARRLHQRCRKKVDMPHHALIAEGFTEEQIAEGVQIYEAGGCEECNQGYKGRVGIYQVMPMTEEIQAIILAGGNAMEIAEVSKKSGVNDLRTSALLKVLQGVTSLAEVNRVTID